MNIQAWLMLLEGAWTTILISGIAIIIGVPAGLGIALLRMAKIPVLEQILIVYTSLARATPLVTLVLFIFLSARTFGLSLDRDFSAILAMTLNTAAFNAEIWRAAFIGFSKEQKEAALACGMTHPVFFRRIMLPQMITGSLPGLINEMSSLIKGSPAIAVIGVVDLTRVTNRIASVTYDSLPPILAAGALYMLIISVLIKAQAIVERNANRLAL